MRKGSHVSNETKKRMSEAHKGKKLTEKAKRKIGKSCSKGYVLDNRRTEPLYFDTLVEVCDFLDYKNIRGFKMGNAYRGYIITRRSK